MDNKRNGYGKILCNDLGIYTYANGYRYEGNWKDDTKTGHGIFYFSDAERYDGEWVNDKKNGAGNNLIHY